MGGRLAVFSPIWRSRVHVRVHVHVMGMLFPVGSTLWSRARSGTMGIVGFGCFIAASPSGVIVLAVLERGQIGCVYQTTQLAAEHYFVTI